MIKKRCVSDTTNFGHVFLTIIGYVSIRAKVDVQDYCEYQNMYVNSVPI